MTNKVTGSNNYIELSAKKAAAEKAKKEKEAAEIEKTEENEKLFNLSFAELISLFDDIMPTVGSSDGSTAKKTGKAAAEQPEGQSAIKESNSKLFAQLDAETQKQLKEVADKGVAFHSDDKNQNSIEKILEKNGYDVEFTKDKDNSTKQASLTISKDGKKMGQIMDTNGNGTLESTEIDFNSSLKSFSKDIAA